MEMHPVPHDAAALEAEAAQQLADTIREAEQRLIITTADAKRLRADLQVALDAFDVANAQLLADLKAAKAAHDTAERELFELAQTTTGITPLAGAARTVFELVQFKGFTVPIVAEGVDLLAWARAAMPSLIRPEHVDEREAIAVASKLPERVRPAWYTERDEMRPQMRRKDIEAKVDQYLAERQLAEELALIETADEIATLFGADQ